jgi:hypothetical protein
MFKDLKWKASFLWRNVMKEKFLYLGFALMVLDPDQISASNDQKMNSEVLELVIENAWRELDEAPNLYPHFLVYGLEVEANVGLSNVVEVGSSLGVELHFERRIK